MPLERLLQARLDAFVAETTCPGAALGIVRDGAITSVAAGVLNTATGYPATPDSLFQIGSITKVWTATLVLQLVDEGLVDLDAPARHYVPDFTLADRDHAERVTVRHLLTHTSGIDGDVFDDVGHNADAVERYVAALADVGPVHGVGETWSYCNAGFVLLGRVVELVRGMPFDHALRQHLVEPLDMGPVATNPAEAIVHRVSVGHLTDPTSGEVSVAPTWQLPQALLPAGLVTTSVGSLLRFGQLHLDGGQDGVLSAGAVQAMQTRQAACPEVDLMADSWGLGFYVKHWGDDVVIGHTGNTVGQSAYLDLVPGKGIGVALLTNCGGLPEAVSLMRGLLAELAGVDTPPLPRLPATPVAIDLAQYVGRYTRRDFGFEIVLDQGALKAVACAPGAATGDGPTQAFDLVPVAEGQFLTAPTGTGPAAMSAPVRFYGGDDGVAFLHTGGRVARRVTEPAASTGARHDRQASTSKEPS